MALRSSSWRPAVQRSNMQSSADEDSPMRESVGMNPPTLLLTGTDNQAHNGMHESVEDTMLYVLVQYEYSAAEPDELSVLAGEKVRLLQVHSDGWYFVSNEKDQRGVVPANHLSDPSVASFPRSERCESDDEPNSDDISIPGNDATSPLSCQLLPSPQFLDAQTEQNLEIMAGEPSGDLFSHASRGPHASSNKSSKSDCMGVGLGNSEDIGRPRASGAPVHTCSDILECWHNGPNVTRVAGEDPPKWSAPGFDCALALAISLVLDTSSVSNPPVLQDDLHSFPSCSMEAGEWWVRDEDVKEIQHDIAWALCINDESVDILCHSRSVLAGEGTCEVVLRGIPCANQALVNTRSNSRECSEPRSFGADGKHQEVPGAARINFEGKTASQVAAELMRQVSDSDSRLRTTKWGMRLLATYLSGPISISTVGALQKARLFENRRKLARWQATEEYLCGFQQRCSQLAQALQANKTAQRAHLQDLVNVMVRRRLRHAVLGFRGVVNCFRCLRLAMSRISCRRQQKIKVSSWLIQIQACSR